MTVPLGLGAGPEVACITFSCLPLARMQLGCPDLTANKAKKRGPPECKGMQKGVGSMQPAPHPLP